LLDFLAKKKKLLVSGKKTNSSSIRKERLSGLKLMSNKNLVLGHFFYGIFTGATNEFHSMHRKSGNLLRKNFRIFGIPQSRRKP